MAGSLSDLEPRPIYRKTSAVKLHNIIEEETKAMEAKEKALKEKGKALEEPRGIIGTLRAGAKAAQHP